MTAKDLIVTDNAIDLAIERLENMEASELNGVFERLSHEQPFLMGFVVGLGEGLENNDAEEDLFYLTMIVWHAIELTKNDKIRTISEDELKDLEDNMLHRFDDIMSYTNDNEEEELANLIGNSRQSALMSYLSDELFSDAYLNLSEDKVAKMFACISVIAETLGEA